MGRLALILSLLAGAVVPARAADDAGALARARALYNKGDFDAALAAADDARRAPERADSADLIAARALLERYRASASNEDLTRARERLRRLGPARLSARERIEYLIGLGETLYFESSAGAAASVFDTVLRAADTQAFDGRDLVLDWWASAVEQDARPRTEFERQALYGMVRVRMREELGRRPSSAAASYWVAAAARGEGDLQAAWDEAQDRKSTRLNSSHVSESRMPSSA